MRKATKQKTGKYVELHCRSNFSFLRGASHPDELCAQAAALGYAGLAITDRNTLAGAVRMHVAAKEHGLQLIVGAEIVPDDAPPLLLFPTDRAAYGRLARLITRGRLRMPKGQCRITFDDIAGGAAGQIAILLPNAVPRMQPDALRGPGPQPSSPSRESDGASVHMEWTSYVSRCRDIFGDRLYLAAEYHRDGDRDAWADRTRTMARQLRLPPVAMNNVYYHVPERRYLQDVLTCIRRHCTLADAGYRLNANAEGHLRPLDEIGRLYASLPDAIGHAVEIADRCRFSLDELRYEYPEEPCPAGTTPAGFLRELAWAGIRARFGDPPPARIRGLVEHELALIAELRYEPYFLTVWDLVRFARSRGILCQGRGSAANSAVCYGLGITAVDPSRHDLLFERFVSRERNEPPDIDIDFEHERREEVFQYIYGKYGRERAGITAEVITYRPRSAVRDVGRALGLPPERVNDLAARLEWWDPDKLPAERLHEAGLDPRDYTVRCLAGLVRRILGFPRHLSQHVGGFVITRTPLCEMVPIENGAMPDRTFIEWDKNDIDALGILKVDCLALGMLTCLNRCFAMINSARGHECAAGNRGPGTGREDGTPGGREALGTPKLTLDTIPPDDPAVYDMLCRADSVGVFQVESRAQMSMLPRLRPRCFYDLVIEVAIVRPGPIQGGMVHPYLRRRNGEEPITYPSPAIQNVLCKTLGIPLFQEQVMRLAVVAGGFTPGEADRLRRAMGAWRRPGILEQFRERLVRGMVANGLSRAFAEQTFEQILGFGEYGFPESHAASFALLVYASAWLKHHYPAAYAAALLNSQPMGFYAPAQIVRDARQHGIDVRGIDVNWSEYDCTLEESDGATGRPSGSAKASPSTQSPVVRASRPAGQGPELSSPRRQERRRAALPCRPVPHVLSMGMEARTSKSAQPCLRLGMRLIAGISRDAVRSIAAARRDGPFRGIADVARRARVGRGVLARLAAADAFRSMGLDRRRALWDVLALREEMPLFAGMEVEEAPAPLPEMNLRERVVADYDATGLSLAAHPIGLIRGELDRLLVLRAERLRQSRRGDAVRVAGLVLVRQRPGTASGVVFATLEDETGIANLMIRPAVYERFRTAAHGFAWIAEGRIDRAGDGVHVQTTAIRDLSESLESLRIASRSFH